MAAQEKFTLLAVADLLSRDDIQRTASEST
jgi:hypothetical protein